MRANIKSKYAPLRFEAAKCNKSFIDSIQSSKKTAPHGIHATHNEFIFSLWYHGGKIIYDLDANLINVLNHTDIHNIGTEMVHFPFNAFYVHLSNSNDEIDGFYFVKDENQLSFLVVSKKIEGMNFGNSYIYPFQIELSPGKTIEKCLADELEAIKNFALEQINKNAKKNGLNLHDEMIIFHETQKLGVKILTDVCRIFFNFLLYIETKENDVVYDWNDELPAQQRSRLKKANNKATIATQEKALLNEGYRKIYFVGKQIGNSYRNFLATESGSKKTPHMRRGHFRLQRHGKNNEQIKVIFIPPMFINASGSDEINAGRIISVK